MNPDGDYNVFKASAEKKGVRNSVKPEGLPISKKKAAQDKEIFEMLSKMKKMHRDIENKLDESYQKLGLNSKEIKAFLENPDNFTIEQWEKVQEYSRKMMKKLEIDLGVMPDSTESIVLSQGQIFAKEKIGKNKLEGPEKERKSKTRGARRNWIPVR